MLCVRNIIVVLQASWISRVLPPVEECEMTATTGTKLSWLEQWKEASERTISKEDYFKAKDVWNWSYGFLVVSKYSILNKCTAYKELFNRNYTIKSQSKQTLMKTAPPPFTHWIMYFSFQMPLRQTDRGFVNYNQHLSVRLTTPWRTLAITVISIIAVIASNRRFILLVYHIEEVALCFV